MTKKFEENAVNGFHIIKTDIFIEQITSNGKTSMSKGLNEQSSDNTAFSQISAASNRTINSIFQDE